MNLIVKMDVKLNHNSETKKAKCECSSKVFIESSIETESGFENQFNIKEINTMFFKSLSNSNFRVLKCYKPNEAAALPVFRSIATSSPSFLSSSIFSARAFCSSV